MDTLKCGKTTPSHSPASPASTLVFNAPMTAFVSNAKQAFSSTYLQLMTSQLASVTFATLKTASLARAKPTAHNAKTATT
jgi:hypothetical protein